MVNVQPFRGLRYDPEVVGDWGAVLGPPYDIVDAAQTGSADPGVLQQPPGAPGVLAAHEVR